MSLLILFSFGCKKGEQNANAAPDTTISIEAINLVGENRLNSTVRLTWFGTDIDGYVDYYEIKVNDSEWFKTNLQDSIFLFDIEPGEDSTDIEFLVRAVDDEGLGDPSPAFLSVPLKNSPPQASFEEETLPPDSTNLVITFRYQVSDPDGNETVKQAFIKANNGDWTEIDLNKRLVSLIAEDTKVTGSTTASFYYGNEEEPTGTINDFNNGGDNIIQLKVVDIANTESVVDSTLVIKVKEQTSDLLVVGGHNAGISKQYADLVSAAYGVADYADFAGNSGLNQPRFWNPSFQLMALSYDKVFFHTNEATFSNPLTGADGTLLDFASPVIQTLVDNDRKVLVSTSFATGTDLTAIKSVLSIDSLSPAKGQAFFTNDSFAVAQKPGYLDLQPSSFLLATDPIYEALDAEVLYTAQLTPSGPWYGPRTIAITRKNQQDNVSLVLFTIEYHTLDKLKSNQEQVLSKVLNEEFNW